MSPAVALTIMEGVENLLGTAMVLSDAVLDAFPRQSPAYQEVHAVWHSIQTSLEICVAWTLAHNTGTESPDVVHYSMEVVNDG